MVYIPLCGVFMRYLEINGLKRLEGEIKIQGSKNSVLPMIAASILTEEKVVIKNCPDISDVRSMIDILEYLGSKCYFNDNVLEIDNSDVVEKELPSDCGTLRASIIFLGAMLARFGRVVMPYPGGCDIGSRPINYHIDGFGKMGAGIACDKDILIGVFEKNTDNCSYTFKTPSLGALENLILGAISLKGDTVFYNCTMEPEIVDFCNFLMRMGAVIQGAGSNTITVKGCKKLHGCTFTVPGDRIVAGTYLTALCMSGGNIRVLDIRPDRMTGNIHYLRKMGVHIFTDYKTNAIIGIADTDLRNCSFIETGPYPMLATDLQPQMLAASCFVHGITGIKDNVYPNRYSIVEELAKMGARICVNKVNVMLQHQPEVIVYGGTVMNGADVYAKDLRAGAALVIAALGCRGISHIYNCGYIDRGYEDIQRDLHYLGADIEWKNDINQKS